MRIREGNRDRLDGVAPEKAARSHRRQKASSIFLTFLISFLTWIILSGKLDRFHLLLGVISCLIVAFLSHDLLFPNVEYRQLFRAWFYFFRYLPWLLYQVFIANLHVMYLVFHPRMMALIDPHVIQFKSRLHNKMSHFIFANSITLTPGTITIYASLFGEYSVHAIDRRSGEALPGTMEEKISKILDE